LERLSRLCAETNKLIAESRARIAHSDAMLDGSPSIVPELGKRFGLADIPVTRNSNAKPN
jgi:hypothetical protein